MSLSSQAGGFWIYTVAVAGECQPEGGDVRGPAEPAEAAARWHVQAGAGGPGAAGEAERE